MMTIDSHRGDSSRSTNFALRAFPRAVFLAVMVALAAWASPTFATGLAECESGPKENWVSKEELQAKLEKQGWQVRKIKEDGGCWEVYAIDEKGNRVEAYFHPETLEQVATESH
jgi:hypothetical protein